ncbi:MAG: nucleotidyltransferase family protein [Desulfurococcales archaeon]|nr:nucleotidyltransferase family protein [Desulfurococcales archaeon]
MGLNTILGIVLVGGESRRFGEPKPLYAVEGVPMGLRVAKALKGGGVSRVVFAAPLERLHIAESLASRCGVCGVLLDPPLPCPGPLRALSAIHSLAGYEHVVVAPGDAPWLDAASVESLIRESFERRLLVTPLYGDGSVNPLITAAPRGSFALVVHTCINRPWGWRATDALRASYPGFAAVGVNLLGDPLTFYSVNTRRELKEPRPPPGHKGATEVLGVQGVFLEALNSWASGRLLWALECFRVELKVYKAHRISLLERHVNFDIEALVPLHDT